MEAVIQTLSVLTHLQEAIPVHVQEELTTWVMMIPYDAIAVAYNAKFMCIQKKPITNP